MQLFEVLKSIETRQILSKTLGEQIDPSKSYLITDDLESKILIYHGPESEWVNHLIAHRLAHEIRIHMRGFYHIDEITNEDFSKLQDIALDPSGKIQELLNPDLYSPEDFAEVLQKTRAIQIKQDSTWRERLSFKDLGVFQKAKPVELLAITKNRAVPPDFFRELILINNAMYSKEDSLMKFFPQRISHQEFVKLGNLPEGRFFLPEYTPRITIEKGSVKVLEFLKPYKEGDMKKLGDIKIDVLPFSRIQKSHDFSILSEAFHLPPNQSLNEFLDQEQGENLKEEP